MSMPARAVVLLIPLISAGAGFSPVSGGRGFSPVTASRIDPAVPVTPASQAAAEGVPQDPSALGYLNLHKRHPDGSEGPVEFATEYTTSHALERLSQIEGFLQSFRRLTDRAIRVLSSADVRSAGNTDGDMQTIGFHNIPLVVEGTILKQDYLLRQAQYELARLKNARGEVGVREFDRARQAYAEATKRFQRFWDTKLPTD